MFKYILKDNFEIAEYIESISVNYIDLEVVEEYFFGCYAILKKVDIRTLNIDDENNHLRSKIKDKKYQSLPLKTMPPLIIENSVIIDGHHRYRTLKLFGSKKVDVYEINYR